tara:strand:- start:1407 stop:1868 length:462 start_codon:yes stop_codon:yes gene_type:complete
MKLRSNATAILLGLAGTIGGFGTVLATTDNMSETHELQAYDERVRYNEVTHELGRGASGEKIAELGDNLVAHYRDLLDERKEILERNPEIARDAEGEYSVPITDSTTNWKYFCLGMGALGVGVASFFPLLRGLNGALKEAEDKREYSINQKLF